MKGGFPWRKRGRPHRPPRRKADAATAVALLFAAALPSLLTWLYFVALAGGGPGDPLRQVAFGAAKVVQFSFPLLFVLLWERRRPRLSRPGRAGLALGLGFGLAVAAGIFGLYAGWLRDSPVLEHTPARLAAVLRGFGVASGPRFLAMAAFYVVAHSLFEEYYYRWFLFGRLRAFVATAPAVALSSLAFMAHHVILLAAYLPGHFWTAAAPLALCVAAGGGVWAWLYARTGSLYAPWLSHAVVDAAILAVGWDLAQRG